MTSFITGAPLPKKNPGSTPVKCLILLLPDCKIVLALIVVSLYFGLFNLIFINFFKSIIELRIFHVFFLNFSFSRASVDTSKAERVTLIKQQLYLLTNCDSKVLYLRIIPHHFRVQSSNYCYLPHKVRV